MRGGGPAGRRRRLAAAAAAAAAAAVALAASACGGEGRDAAGSRAAPAPPPASTGGPASAGPSTSTAAPAPPPPRAGQDGDAPPTAPRGEVLDARVVRVVDGDTIHVRSAGFDTPVRLIGVDTPETRHPSRPVGCWGPEASALAARLMPVGGAVRLRTDPTQDTRDRYGRLLAHVYAGDARDADSVNRALIAAGAGRVYVYGGRDFTHVEAFRRAERAARAAGRGLWGPPCRGRVDGEGAAPSTPRPPATGEGADCAPGYTGACVPPHPPDVDCGDVGRVVTVEGDDPHRLDGDGNGVGCEGFRAPAP